MIVCLARVTCDTDDCEAVSSWGADAAQAWRLAKAVGWVRDGAEHRCPQHAPENYLVEQIRALAARKLGDARIGGRLGVSRETVRRLRVANDIAGRRPGRPSGSGS